MDLATYNAALLDLSKEVGDKITSLTPQQRGEVCVGAYDALQKFGERLGIPQCLPKVEDTGNPLSEPLQEVPSEIQKDATPKTAFDRTALAMPTANDFSCLSKQGLKKLRKQLKKAVKVLKKKE